MHFYEKTKAGRAFAALTGCFWLFSGTIFSRITAQGPIDGYLKGKGVLDIVASASSLSARKFWGAGYEPLALSYRATAVSLFSEYGISKRVDAVFTANYVFTSTQQGLQDGSFFLKYRPFYRQLRHWGRLGLLGAGGVFSPLARYDVTNTGALGQRAVAAAGRVVAQLETTPGPFFNMTVGYDLRLDRISEAAVNEVRKARPDFVAENPPDAWVVMFKTGLPTRRVYTDVWLEYRQSLGGGAFVPGLPGLPQTFDADQVQIGGTVFYSENGRSGFFSVPALCLPVGMWPKRCDSRQGWFGK